MAIRAVLFDVGGPIDTEVAYERLIDEQIREGLAAEGFSVSADEFETAGRYAVESFAPNAYQAMIWRLSGRDPDTARRVYEAVAARAAERQAARGGIELRHGIAEVLDRLCDRGLLLGLVANQAVDVLAELDRLGIGHCFAHREVSGTHGLRKPDPRLFLPACDALGVAPAETLMVGDRIDNDIAPARLLGMRAILFRTGRHIAQQPRSWEETPDAEVFDVHQLEAAICRLVESG